MTTTMSFGKYYCFFLHCSSIISWGYITYVMHTYYFASELAARKSARQRSNLPNHTKKKGQRPAGPLITVVTANKLINRELINSSLLISTKLLMMMNQFPVLNGAAALRLCTMSCTEPMLAAMEMRRQTKLMACSNHHRSSPRWILSLAMCMLTGK